MATSDGLRVPSPQRAPLYLCMTVWWRHRTDCEFLHHRGHHSIYAGPYGGDIGRTASSFTTEGTTLSMHDRTVATSDGLRVPSSQRAPLYLCMTVRWRHRTDCDHHRGHHSIYAGSYGGDIGRTASSFITEGTTLSMQDRTVATSDGLRVPSPQRAPLYLCTTVRWRHRTDCDHHRGHHSMQDRTVATSDGLRVPSPQRAPLYLCRTVRWRHRTDCEFLHHRGHHSIYAGPYGGDIGRTASSFTTEGTTLSMQDRTAATSDGLQGRARGW